MSTPVLVINFYCTLSYWQIGTGGQYIFLLTGGSGTFVHVSVDSTKFYYELNEESANSWSILKTLINALCKKPVFGVNLLIESSGLKEFH